MKNLKRILLSVVACTITVHAHASVQEYASQALEQIQAFAWNHKGKIATGIALLSFGYWVYRTYKNFTQKLVTRIEYSDIIAVPIIETKEITTPVQQAQPNGFNFDAIKKSRSEARKKSQDEQPRLPEILYLKATNDECACVNKAFRTLEDLTQLKTMKLCYEHRAYVMCYALDMSDKMIQSNREAAILFFDIFNVQINELKKEGKKLPELLKRAIILFDIINSNEITMEQRISYDTQMIQCLKEYCLPKK